METMDLFNNRIKHPYLLQYRQMRREQDQLVLMDADHQKMKEMAEFELRKEESLKAAEEWTPKKHLKRQKERTKTSNGADR